MPCAWTREAHVLQQLWQEGAGSSKTVRPAAQGIARFAWPTNDLYEQIDGLARKEWMLRINEGTIQCGNGGRGGELKMANF